MLCWPRIARAPAAVDAVAETESSCIDECIVPDSQTVTVPAIVVVYREELFTEQFVTDLSCSDSDRLPRRGIIVFPPRWMFVMRALLSHTK